MTTPASPTVAYFSAEYAIADDLPIYAGGLGILAADLVMEAAEQQREFYAMGLVYHLAFTGDDADQRPMTQRLLSDGFELATTEDGRHLTVDIQVAERPVRLQAWVKSWGKTKLILLDSRLDENAPEDQAICDVLYAKDPSLQLAQEMCLGFGGVAMLVAMGVEPTVYHLNEGHAALGGLAVVLRELAATPGATFAVAHEAARHKLVGTKHTILAGAGILLDWQSVTRQLEPTLAKYGATIDDVKTLADKQNHDYSDTKMLIHLVRAASGVSRIHVVAEKHDHANSPLVPITNGVYRGRWLADNWNNDPLGHDDATLWKTHAENRRQLLGHVKQQTGDELDPDKLTVVWARRMTAYKRPGLLVSDLERLAALVRNAERPMQFIVAGKANPADAEGVELMNRVIAAAARPELAASFAYLPHYNPASAKFLVRGADLWLNTPIRGYEACGTSGMKASMNGALQFSTSDGWIDEVKIPPIGWRLPEADSATALYELLEREIAPLFYGRDGGLPKAWIVKMRANMQLVLDEFTATRMLNDYYEQLYVTGEVA